MGGLLFVSQSILDTWAGQGKIDFSGNVMSILAGDGQGRSYRLEPAVRFLKVVGAEVDPHQLLHKVKGEAQLRELGAEVMEGAVILGEVGYEVETGFLAEAAALQAAAASRADPARAAAPARPAAPAAPPPAQAAPPPAAPPGAGQAPSPKELEDRRKEAEALARFLLENLS
jgi:hypothetical protein